MTHVLMEYRIATSANFEAVETFLELADAAVRGLLGPAADVGCCDTWSCHDCRVITIEGLWSAAEPLSRVFAEMVQTQFGPDAFTVRTLCPDRSAA